MGKPVQKPQSRELPHSNEAELAVLGSIVIRPNCIERVAEIIDPADFYRATHRTLFESMLALHRDRQVIDALTLSEYLQKHDLLEAAGGVDLLAGLTDVLPTPAHVEHYAEIITDRALLRSLLATAWDIVETGYTTSRPAREVLLESEGKLFELAQIDSKATKALSCLAVESKDFVAQIEAQRSGEAFSSIGTGLVDFDRMTGGLRPGELIIIAARPSMGKSMLAQNIAEHIAFDFDRDTGEFTNAPVAFFSLEMPKRTIFFRSISAKTRIEARKIFECELNEFEVSAIKAAADSMIKNCLFVDDSGGVNVDQIRSRCRRIKAEHGLSAIFIDYIQLMGHRRGIDVREQQVSDISRNLKLIAKEMDVPVVALSQLNRDVEKRTDKRPQLSDIRESGSIEQDADIVAFVYRREYYHPNDADGKGEAEIIVGKNRNGKVGSKKFRFNGACMRFEDLAEDWRE